MGCQRTNSSDRSLSRHRAIVPIAYNPGPAEDEHLFRSGLFEQAGTGVARRATGVNIIDEQDGPAGDSWPLVPTKPKCGAHRFLPLRAAHAPQGRRRLTAENGVIVHFYSSASSQLSANEDRLVETALPEP